MKPGDLVVQPGNINRWLYAKSGDRNFVLSNVPFNRGEIGIVLEMFEGWYIRLLTSHGSGWAYINWLEKIS